MEITTGDDQVFIREDGRIVCHGIDFGEQYRSHMMDGIFGCSMHLRDASEGIRVLHMLLRTSDEFASFQDTAEESTRFDLSFVRAHLLDAIHERVDTSVKSLQWDGSNQVGAFDEAESFQDSIYTVGAHELGTIQQSQSFLAFQTDGFPTEFIEHTDGFASFSFIIYIAYTDERKEEVGQRSQVARCSEWTTVVHNRQYIVVEEIDDTLYSDDLYPAMTQRQSMGFQEEHQFHDERRHLGSYTAGMALHQILL